MSRTEPSGAEPVQEREQRVRRAKRLTAVAALSLVGLAIAVPQAAIGCIAVFLVLMIVLHWPCRPEAEGVRAAAAERRAVVWPTRGMKALAEALQEPALIIDRDMLLRYRNPASSVAFGNMTLGDPVALRFRSPELLAAIERSIERAEVEVATIDERRPVERTWQIEILPVPPYQGERPHFFLLLFRDQTPAVWVERMRTEFVANASHELRTPLASLAGFIETLQGPAKNDAVARERFLAIMREQAFRMSRLIDDLLSLSRIEMKRHVPVSSTADLVAVFRAVQSQMEPVVADSGMRIELKVPEGAVPVTGEEDELVQVFANLVENACKYAASGGRVEMTISRTVEHGEAKVDASVRDFGEGIPAEHVPRLTERFYRVSVGTSRAKQGTGLGLSIVRNILVRHRARLLVQSEVGKGSTFTARFPAGEAASGESAAASAA